jgi:hypothetical protein
MKLISPEAEARVDRLNNNDPAAAREGKAPEHRARELAHLVGLVKYRLETTGLSDLDRQECLADLRRAWQELDSLYAGPLPPDVPRLRSDAV